MAKIAKFSIIERPNKKAVFRDLPGWKFDEGVWAGPDLANTDYRFPKKSDLDLTSIPETYYESGVVEQHDIEFDEINFEDKRLATGWTPGVHRGQYFVHEKRHALHGTESITKLVRDETPTSGEYADFLDISTLTLNQDPHPLLPITAEYLTRDPVTFAIKSGQTFTKVVKFKGVASNGRERNSSVREHIDTSVYQFRVERNDSEPQLNSPIFPVDLSALGSDVYSIQNALSPIRWYQVKFSRPDIFRTELSYELFDEKQHNPDLSLDEGDYCIGYRNSPGDGAPIKVYLTVAYQEYGAVSYKPDFDAHLIFNRDVRLPKVEAFANVANETIFLLADFPCLDLTSFDNDNLVNAVSLDDSTTEVEVDAVLWSRVAALTGQGDAAEVYTLDPLYGVLEFGTGAGGPGGAAPVGNIQVTYTQVPLVQYDTLSSRELFDDNREDLDPQTNALKRGFLVLDNTRPLPYKIVLSASGAHTTTGDYCCYGPLSVPPGGDEDIRPVRARVLARGLPDTGVPNIPVQFKCPDDLVIFSQEFAVTDGDGYAHTEVQGQGVFDNFIVTNHVYKTMDAAAPAFLNPDTALLDLEPSLIPAPKQLTVLERFSGAENSVYLLIQSMRSIEANQLFYAGQQINPGDDPEPYNGKTRKGGVTVVWTQTVLDAEKVIHPDSYVTNNGITTFTFPAIIPTGRLIVGYKIVIDRTTEVTACTTEDPILLSNSINFCMELNEGWKGQWKLPNLLSPDDDGFTENLPLVANTDSSRISSAVYMSPNDFTVAHIEAAGSGGPLIISASEGDGIDIIGTSFPFQATGELDLSVFIVAVDGDEITGVINIASENITFVSATIIRITALPTPPGAYGTNYWIAVGGFHPDDGDGARQTATQLQIDAP